MVVSGHHISSPTVSVIVLFHWEHNFIFIWHYVFDKLFSNLVFMMLFATGHKLSSEQKAEYPKHKKYS